MVLPKLVHFDFHFCVDSWQLYVPVPIPSPYLPQTTQTFLNYSATPSISHHLGVQEIYIRHFIFRHLETVMTFITQHSMAFVFLNSYHFHLINEK